MVGIFVEAEILVPGGLYDSKGEPVMTTQTIRSPGLWGIESDSEQSYFREVAGEEIDALIDQLTALGISRSQIEKAQVDDKEIR